MSLQGTSHKASGTVCQDSSCTTLLDNGWAIAVIADGLGSAKHSDIGSFLAVNTVVEYVKKHCPKKWVIPKIITVLKNSFSVSLDLITKRAVKEKNPLNDYDTTLTVAVYNGSQAVFGHVGDGGIITLSRHGDYSMLTRPHKGGEFNMVSPLKCEGRWTFGNSDNDICALSMFTDGIYDIVCPWILSEQKQPVYVNYVRPFMDRNVLKVHSMKDFMKIKNEVELFL
ncbi:MAG: protein phosphatase 2C domain-containing protein, partial [Oscillospiraceae bacterium]|nr:protein phosphatase 2C domain-containing protein [Oscillospiraceae bacterium]